MTLERLAEKTAIFLGLDLIDLDIEAMWARMVFASPAIDSEEIGRPLFYVNAIRNGAGWQNIGAGGLLENSLLDLVRLHEGV